LIYLKDLIRQSRISVTYFEKKSRCRRMVELSDLRSRKILR